MLFLGVRALTRSESGQHLFSVGLPRTAWVIVCGMSVLDDISCHFNSVTPSKQNSNAISTCLSVKNHQLVINEMPQEGKQTVSWSLSLQKSRFGRILSHRFIRFFNLLQRLYYGCDITSLDSPKQAKASRLFHIWLLRARSLFLDSKREIRGFAFLKKWVHIRELCEIIIIFDANAFILLRNWKQQAANEVAWSFCHQNRGTKLFPRVSSRKSLLANVLSTHY